jgi:hypothetical protein
MKTSLLTTRPRVRSAISNTTHAGAKRFSERLFTPFLATGLALGVLVAMAVNSANASTADEGKNIAALDTQDQAAVKKNDTAAMDRILADDFILVTGAGKTYTKADLLDEARSGRVLYERQDDSSQTVHVWGETAVVTAKLWAKRRGKRKAFRTFALVQ